MADSCSCERPGVNPQDVDRLVGETAGGLWYQGAAKFLSGLWRLRSLCFHNDP